MHKIDLALVSAKARAVQEAKNFDVSLRLFYFVNQIIATNEPPNVGSVVEEPSAVREISELSFVQQSRRKSPGRLSILFAGRYEERRYLLDLALFDGALAARF
jgi:hypothetical protein